MHAVFLFRVYSISSLQVGGLEKYHFISAIMATCSVMGHPLATTNRVTAARPVPRRVPLAGLGLQQHAPAQRTNSPVPVQQRTFNRYPSPACSTSSIGASRKLVPTTMRRVRSARPAPAVTPSQLNERRNHVSGAVQEYLKSLNAMTRSIVLETATVEKENEDRWTGLNESLKQEIMDDHFIPSGVRFNYEVGNWRRKPSQAFISVPVVESLNLSQPTGEDEWEYMFEQSAAQSGRNNTTGGGNHCTAAGALLAVPHMTGESVLSQPSGYNYEPDSETFTICSRLHKRQLSFRASNFHRVETPSQQQQELPSPSVSVTHHERESSRTSDEENPLGFTRNRLRSFSMRPKRSSARYPAALRNSTRSAHRVRLDQTSPTAQQQHCSITSTSKKSDSSEDNYNTTGCEGDDEIDLPEETMMLDHVPADTTPKMNRLRPQRYSKTRRSKRSKPKIVLEDTSSGALQTASPCGEELIFTKTTTSDSSLPVLSRNNSLQSTISNTMCKSFSQESLDAISITPSTCSRLDDSSNLGEDHLTCRTPDSMLSSYSHKIRSKDMASFRQKSKRGGSTLQTTTSDFADRKALFKPNMLRNRMLNSCANSAASTREATPVPQDNNCELRTLSQTSLKPPSFSKYNSLVESVTTDLPSSPDHLSPPDTPLTHIQHHRLSKRESGYLSSGYDNTEDDTMSERAEELLSRKFEGVKLYQQNSWQIATSRLL